MTRRQVKSDERGCLIGADRVGCEMLAPRWRIELLIESVGPSL